MTLQPITVNLPGDLYERLKNKAEQKHRSIEDTVIDTLASAVPMDDLTPELKHMLQSLSQLSDLELQRAAQSNRSLKEAAQLRRLNEKRSKSGPTAREDETRSELLRQMDRKMLLRAEALRLLKERGHDISALLTLR